MHNLNMISASAEKEVERLLSNLLNHHPALIPWKNKVYTVGGFVRDELLGIPSKDLDLVIEQPEGAKNLSRLLHSFFPESTSQALPLGEAYPIWRLLFQRPIGWEGKMFATQGAVVDFADTQKETFPDPLSRQRKTVFGSLSEDMARRDFTVNMLLRDLTSGQILDLSATGLADLKQGILRGHPQVGLDQTFSEDPLRMLRLIRFHCRFGWTIPTAVKQKVIEQAHRISIVSSERIRDELFLILSLGKLKWALEFMHETKLLTPLFPELCALQGVEQDVYSHSEGDVWTHTLLVVEKAKPTPLAQLAALLHDIGKPFTQTRQPQSPGEPDRIRFLGHESIGAEQAGLFLKKLRVDATLIFRIKKIILHHLRAHSSKQWSPTAIRKFIRDCGTELEEILDLTENDLLSSYRRDGKPGPNPIPDLRVRIHETLQIPIQKKPSLNGSTVMQLLQLIPGPAVKKAMDLLLEIEDEQAAQGKKNTEEELKRLLKERHSKLNKTN